MINKEIFESIATKTISNNDINKDAIYLIKSQVELLCGAGIIPGEGGENAVDIELFALEEGCIRKISASYYKSLRKGSGRNPEYRVGREIIDWVEAGDSVTFARYSGSIYIWKEEPKELLVGELANIIFSKLDSKKIIETARSYSGDVVSKCGQFKYFVRNPEIVAGALARANGVCEFPDCSHELFYREDGSAYLEVHHIVPLSEKGTDTMDNVAALCPMCHREMHFGKNRIQKTDEIKIIINDKETKSI